MRFSTEPRPVVQRRFERLHAFVRGADVGFREPRALLDLIQRGRRLLRGGRL